jgi:hypothetical protein
MSRKYKLLNVFVVIALLALGSWTIVSCGGGGGGGGAAPLPTTQQAAASSSAAMGSVQLSATIGQASSMASGAIPAGYAPGKTTRSDTSAIAKIDPRLKDIVDQMMAKLEKPMIKNTVGKATLSKVYSAPVATVFSACSITGTYLITVNSITSSGTATINSIAVTFNKCRDVAGEEMHGTLSATHSFDTVASSETSTVTTNLSFNDYDPSFTTMNSIATISGNFNSSVTGTTNATGRNYANGLFSVTTPTVNGMTMAFTFTNVTDVWSATTTTLGTTTQNTGNGAFALSMKDNSVIPSATLLSLTITNTNLIYKVFTAATYQDEWINGMVTIGWVPDLSQYGCLGGNYTFTTAAATPIHTPSASTCPTSGKTTLNSAVIEFGKPAGVQVTVTVGSGTPAVFTDCNSLDSGACM